MEGDKLQAEKIAVLQSYLGTTWQAAKGAVGSFTTVDHRNGFYPAHIFWVRTREEFDDNRKKGISHSTQLATVPRGDIDYFIFGEHSIDDLKRQRDENLKQQALATL